MLSPEPIRITGYGDAQFHLVEAVATSGLSGSPVFVHESLFFRSAHDDSSVATAVGKSYCLGLVHGFMTLDTMTELSGKDPNQKWHPALTLVVPAEKILEVLNQPELIAYEENAEHEAQKQGSKAT